MTVALILLAVCVAAAVVGGMFIWESDLALFPFVLGVGGAFTITAVVLIALLVPRHDQTVCERFADASGRETKFEHYSFWSWECLVETDEGWVSRGNIIKVDD